MNISLSPSGNFVLAVPSEGPLSGGIHHITIPATLTGLSVLKKILGRQARKREAIGTDSAPTQYMVEQWLKADADAKAQALAKRLADQGIDLDKIKVSL